MREPHPRESPTTKSDPGVEAAGRLLGLWLQDETVVVVGGYMKGVMLKTRPWD
jgi:hypothetical protein